MPLDGAEDVVGWRGRRRWTAWKMPLDGKETPLDGKETPLDGESDAAGTGEWRRWTVRMTLLGGERKFGAGRRGNDGLARREETAQVALNHLVIKE